ncbi:MAG: hypothetical protein IPH35_13855 [Rhodoferax sp.]|nr:hypothetical protein [Rhodoferax sp.]
MHSSSNDEGSGFGSFFRYHGWLAPGVRMFRRVGFPVKAAWICITFMLPILAMMLVLWSAERRDIDFASSERNGLRVVEPTISFINAVQHQRRAATAQSADLADTQAKASAAFDKLREKHAQFGSVFGTQESFNALDKAYQTVARASFTSDADKTFAAHTAVVSAALDFISHVADGSKLSLDPELETYHLMNFSVLVGPNYAEFLARLRGLGYVSVKTGEIPAERGKLLQQTRALMAYVDASVENSYKIGIESNPEVARQFDMDGNDKAREAFLSAVDTQVLAGAPTGDAATLLTLGNAAVDRELALEQQVRERLDVVLSERIARLQNAFYLQMFMSTSAVLLALYFMLSFYKVTMGGLREVAGHLEEISKGNLTTAPTPWGSDEAAALMLTMGQMQNTLRHIAQGMQDSSSIMRVSSMEVASVAQEISSTAEASAIDLEKTASSMEQISSTVQRTSDMVQSAAGIARENVTFATRGGEVIAQVVSTMEEIQVSSNRIGEIISVIDGIAFQTNILALNAAVEAARAGEEGRGFAVVASEVRALAGRSAAAAKEIKSLISTSMQQVTTGNRVVADAGATMRAIVDSATQIGDMMSEISTATSEQSIGVSHVGSAMQNLDRGTQNNVALVEETAAAAHALSEQAENLAREVGFFKLQ